MGALVEVRRVHCVPCVTGRPLHIHALISTLTWGGAEMLLADFAAGARSAHIELSVGYLQEVDGSPAAARLRDAGIEPCLVPITGLLNPRDLMRVRRHLVDMQPDLLHTHLGNADLMGGLAARSLGLPVVSTIHVMEWDAERRERVKARLMDLARRHCSAAVITVSDRARAALLDAGYGRGVRLVTVHNGVDADPEPGKGREVRAELGLDADDLVVTMVSVLREGKGHEVAIEAFRGLRRQRPNLRLLIVGDGPRRDHVHRMARELGRAAVLAGHRDDVLNVLDASDVLLHPSHADAFPTALLEAFAASVPVVATAVGGIPEIVTDGETGVLVAAPPRSEAVARALERVLDDRPLRRRLGAAGRGRFEAEFSAQRWAQRTREVYEAALRA